MENEGIINFGYSTCPICKGSWLVTPFEDCLLPACGCYGYDVSKDNPDRPHESCGLVHAFSCAKMPKPTISSKDIPDEEEN